jgi:hypothetical protein
VVRKIWNSVKNCLCCDCRANLKEKEIGNKIIFGENLSEIMDYNERVEASMTQKDGNKKEKKNEKPKAEIRSNNDLGN